MRLHKLITSLLLILVLMDLALSVWGFFFPEAWYAIFHDANYIDPQGLLRRCAANWLAFFILQAIALFAWKRSPWWIVVVAGCRLGDCMTDITCLVFSESISTMGKIGFPLAGLGNLFLGITLILLYKKIILHEKIA